MSIAATQITFSEKLTVAAFRHLAMPMLEMLAGIRAPEGRLTEHRYGELTDETLDVITPASTGSPKAAIVFIHGGGWISGSKGKFYNRPLMKFADAGHTVFSVNYPLAPEHPHPHILRSVLKALAWIKREHPAHKDVHFMGDSAGGNLAMMLGLMLANPKLLPIFDSIDPATLPRVRSVVPIYGVMDRTTWIEDGFPAAKTMLTSYAGVAALSGAIVPAIPVTPMDIPHVDELPPTFIVAASQDKLARSSRIYAEHLRKNFKQVDYKVYEGVDHGFFCFGGPQHEELCRDILQFLATAAQSPA